ncbi:MAG TPA: hypothetical protein VFR97_12105, partial [Capillimicrobium sp.]|nr:hypothetical protein [Capillimicrobium sp.]
VARRRRGRSWRSSPARCWRSWRPRSCWAAQPWRSPTSSLRDDDGFYLSDAHRLVTRTPALTGEGLQLGDVSGDGDRVIDELAVDGRIVVTGPRGRRLFVGIAAEPDVARYLAGVAHDRVGDVGDGDVSYRRVPGRREASPPGRETFWVASSAGTGEQTLDWDVEGGTWSAVVMNADGSPGVAADVRVGVRIGWLLWAGLGILALGLVLGAGAGLLIWVGVRDPDRRARPPQSSPPPEAPPPTA